VRAHAPRCRIRTARCVRAARWRRGRVALRDRSTVAPDRIRFQSRAGPKRIERRCPRGRRYPPRYGVRVPLACSFPTEKSAPPAPHADHLVLRIVCAQVDARERKAWELERLGECPRREYDATRCAPFPCPPMPRLHPCTLKETFPGLMTENQRLVEELDEANRKLKLVRAIPRPFAPVLHHVTLAWLSD